MPYIVLAALVVALTATCLMLFLRAEAQLPYPPAHASGVWRRCAEFDAWDRGVRGRLGFFAGLQFLGRTSDPYIVNLAVRSWPHLTCWQWLLSWNWVKPTETRRLFRFSGMAKASVHGAQSWIVDLLWVGQLRYQRQAADRCVTGGPWIHEAPVIFPAEVALNPIEEAAADEYREGVSAGAAARQLTRTLAIMGSAPTLQRMLQDLLADGNRASHDRNSILREFSAAAPDAARDASARSFKRNNARGAA